jgi:hypothetical protein
MKNIIALTDYKDRFGSKHFDTPYRSGMDKQILEKCFNNLGYSIDFVQISKIANRNNTEKDPYFIYTSSEDINYYYKSYIEDVIFYLESQKRVVIPSYKYLRANNNKVFMELLRKSVDDSALFSVRSQVYGTYEEAIMNVDRLNFPVVIKTAEGASGSGVFKADNIKEFQKMVRKVSSSIFLKQEMKEIIRSFLHKGYIKESNNRKKFIVQNMITGLKNDWKVYVFGEKYFVFYRPVLKHRGFRASGGGYDNYFYDEDAFKPEGFFDFVRKIASFFNVPHISMDIAWDGNIFHLIEIQFIYFGTAGIPYSKGYYTFVNNKTEFFSDKLNVEEVYAQSIKHFIDSNNL